ncbi:hypothetical protein MNEG_8333, partial [Monoraphidium neglectum]
AVSEPDEVTAAASAVRPPASGPGPQPEASTSGQDGSGDKTRLVEMGQQQRPIDRLPREM